MPVTAEELARDYVPQLYDCMQDLGVISTISLSWFLKQTETSGALIPWTLSHENLGM